MTHSAPSSSRAASAPTVPADNGFVALRVPTPIASALFARGITEPFPIQTATLPDSLAGRDVIGRGRTGSGKTVAFAVPMVATLAASKAERKAGAPRGLILVPTRELAAQVAETLQPLATSLGLRVVIIHGGVSAGPQVRGLQQGADIVVACPGRLEDLMQQHHCRLDRIEVTVLDEADHMADLGFLPSVKRIMDKTPIRGQRLLFSATLDNGVDVLVKRYLDNPVSHSVDSAESPVPDMEHHVLHTALGDKLSVVSTLASGLDRTLLFTRTKHGAKKLARQLSMDGIPSVELHGNLSQNARARNLDQFTAGEVRVLVATDIAARGIHVDDITLVIHVDPPAEHKAFLHRSGRTARAGAAGTVVTIVTPDQKRDVDQLTRKAGIRPTVTAVDPRHTLLRELAGPAAPRQAAPKPQPQQANRPQQAARPQQPGGRQQPRSGKPSARPKGRGRGPQSGNRPVRAS